MSHFKVFIKVFLYDGQGSVRRAILYTYRSCLCIVLEYYKQDNYRYCFSVVGSGINFASMCRHARQCIQWKSYIFNLVDSQMLHAKGNLSFDIVGLSSHVHYSENPRMNNSKDLKFETYSKNDQ